MGAKALLMELQELNWKFLSKWGLVNIQGVSRLNNNDVQLVEHYAKTYDAIGTFYPLMKPPSKVEAVLNAYGLYF